MKVRFTPSARSQVLTAVEYIREDNPLAARRFRQRAERDVRRLSQFPNLGRKLPEFPDLPFREVIVVPYRFFYRVEGKIVWIAAVCHCAQMFGTPAGG